MEKHIILDSTIKADYEPGTNQSEDLACADWRFLLPSMEIEKVLCIGAPKISTLKVLSKMAGQIYIANAAQTSHIDATLAELNNVTVQEYDELLFKDETVGLILLSNEGAVQRVVEDKKYLHELFRILIPDGSIYFENKGLKKIFKLEKRMEKWLNNGLSASHQKFWLTTQSGEMRTALPVSERDISSFFFQNVLFGQSFKKRMMSKAGRMLSEVGLISYANQKRAMLIQKTAANENAQRPPKFLRELANNAGIDIDRFRFGLSARGKYNSNKIVFYLFDNQRYNAEMIIKMTRIERFNCRLEHEWEMLSTVKSNKFVPDGTYPAPLMFGYHKNLAVLGQSAVKGHPFRTQTSAKPDCPIAADAIKWITTLGKNSANYELASPKEVSKSLIKLFDIFSGIYKLSAAHSDFLRGQIESIAKSKVPFPVIFGHGDAGSWNVIVRDGKALFLDWEAAEPQGMPLWDMFYFIRSFGNWVSREQHKSLDTLKNFNSNFVEKSPLSELLAKSINQYCDAIKLDKSLVAPMFYTCWMHRALRQATWADNLQTAHFVSVIRMCIDQHKAAGLQSLFTLK